MNTKEILQGIKDWAAPKVIYDISAAHNNTKYADLSDALGTDGGNIPQEYRKGGITVRYVQSPDNKYVQYRYMGTDITGTPNPFLDEANWQGVDDKPNAGSDNLVKSNGIFESQKSIKSQVNKQTFYAKKAVLSLSKSGKYMNADGTYSNNGNYDVYNLLNFTNDQIIDIVVFIKGSVIPMALLFNSNNEIIKVFDYATSEGAYEHIRCDLTEYPTASYLKINTYQYSTHNPIDISSINGTILTENYPEKIDGIPTEESLNLVRSGGVCTYTHTYIQNNVIEFIDISYKEKKNGCYVNNQNEEIQLSGIDLYYYDVRKSSIMKVYTASVSAGYCLFVDDENNIIGTPFKNATHYISEWKTVSVPEGATILKVSCYKATQSHPYAYPVRVLGNHQDYSEQLGNNLFNKTIVNVGMSIWWLDGTEYRSENTIDGEGTICKGYQSWMGEYFHFGEVVKYAYSGASLGVGNKASSSIMYNYSSEWTAHEDAVWTLDTITNDFGRSVPLGIPSDFDNATGINTYYGALRAFKDKVATLSPDAVIVCSNSLYRGDKTTNSLGLTLEDYEEALCYAAAKSGWFFVDQFRTTINAHNYHVALYDGLHPTNFGFRLAVKPWIEQFDIIQKTILE